MGFHGFVSSDALIVIDPEKDSPLSGLKPVDPLTLHTGYSYPSTYESEPLTEYRSLVSNPVAENAKEPTTLAITSEVVEENDASVLAGITKLVLSDNDPKPWSTLSLNRSVIAPENNGVAYASLKRVVP